MCKTAENTAQAAVPPAPLMLEPIFLFPAAVYSIKLPQFLGAAKTVVKEAIAVKRKEVKKLNEIYPVIMTDNLHTDPRLESLVAFVGQTAWNILDGQGYAMQNLLTYFTEFWCQEHHKHSAMEQHVHGFGSQLVGFYFVDVPKDSSVVLFHDPKAGKVQANLPEKDMNKATFASNVINFVPEEGLCMFAPAWLAHSFTRHAANKPMRFIHFNISVQAAVPTSATPAAEVI
jgi:uncharacterized protein (TIGR02466 family)